MAVITWVLPHLTTVNLPALLGVYLLLSVALGVAMAAIVEYPILRVRDRYWPARPIHAPALAMAGAQ